MYHTCCCLCWLNQIVYHCYSTTSPRTASDDMDGVSARKFVHLVRHGKYLGSSVGEVLSPIGIRQAELTGGRLQQIVSQGNPRRKLAGIMHSSIPRAAHTTGIIAKYFPNVSVEPSELHCGKDPSNPTSVKSLDILLIHTNLHALN